MPNRQKNLTPEVNKPQKTLQSEIRSTRFKRALCFLYGIASSLKILLEYVTGQPVSLYTLFSLVLTISVVLYGFYLSSTYKYLLDEQLANQQEKKTDPEHDKAEGRQSVN
ncbi:hypothetical protein [Pantoea sp. A4]|uniref:hypothetical protein n=1 Tax=Pantoea sp. A4 TaxID=1225184 RepID=UPI0003712A79|nr:hypothetical protein [Pantoea sp. A4]